MHVWADGVMQSMHCSTGCLGELGLVGLDPQRAHHPHDLGEIHRSIPISVVQTEGLLRLLFSIWINLRRLHVLIILFMTFVQNICKQRSQDITMITLLRQTDRLQDCY